MNDDELTPEQKFAAEDIEVTVFRQLVNRRPKDQILSEIQKHGYSVDKAVRFMRRVRIDVDRYLDSPESRAKLVAEARNQFLIGLVILIGGLGLSALTFLATSLGAVMMFVGAMIGSGVLMNSGWSRWQLFSRDVMED